MDTSKNTSGQSPPREENVEDRQLAHEEEVLIKRIIGQSLEAFMPTMISRVESIMTERFNEFERLYVAPLRNIGASSTHKETNKEKFEYKSFATCNPPEFSGELNPVISNRWISELEETFLLCKCPDESKVIYAAHQLKANAHEWWNSQLETYGFEVASKFTWDKFKEIFREEFSPPAEVEKLKGEFLTIEHGSRSVAEYSKVFHEKARFCQEYTSNPKLLTDHFYRHLNLEIRESIDPLVYNTIAKILNRALMREKDLQARVAETVSKRKVEHSTLPSTKKTRYEDVVPQPQPLQQVSSQTQPKEIPPCEKCGRKHTGECKCFKCGRPGHMASNCPSPLRLCYYCFKGDHLQADCPDKARDKRKRMEDYVATNFPRPKTRAYQITSGEEKESSGVTSGTHI